MSFPNLWAAAEQAENIVGRLLHDDTPTDELAQAWVDLRNIVARLSVLERDLSTTAARRLADIDYDDGYELPTGDVVHHRQTSRDAWRGRDVVHALSWDLVDPDTGELHPAVPVSVLLEVLPAMGEHATSSRWRATGLKNLDVDPDRYRTREWQPARLYEGPRK